MTKLFDAKFGVSKRFPKKDGDTNSYNPINVTVVSLDKFPELLSDKKPQVEIIKTRSKDDIF
jgi:hypothetical protein